MARELLLVGGPHDGEYHRDIGDVLYCYAPEPMIFDPATALEPEADLPEKVLYRKKRHRIVEGVGLRWPAPHVRYGPWVYVFEG